MSIASTFDVEYQGKNLQNCMATLARKCAIPVEQRKNCAGPFPFHIAFLYLCLRVCPEKKNLQNCTATLSGKCAIHVEQWKNCAGPFPFHIAFFYLWLCVCQSWRVIMLVKGKYFLKSSMRGSGKLVALRYLRNFQVETMGLKETPRRCSNVNCKARLRDTVLDWEPTPKDAKACLVIRGFVDEAIAELMHLLNLWIPPYVRVGLFRAVFNQFHCIGDKKINRQMKKIVALPLFLEVLNANEICLDKSVSPAGV